MAIADLLAKLVELKSQLVANLNSMGVTTDESEKLNTLVPKVLECKTKQNVEFVEGLSNDFTLATACKSVIIPVSVTSIGANAFNGCTNLASITIPVSVTRIGVKAFNECTNLANIYYKGTKEQWNAITKDTNWNLNMGSNVEGGTVITYNYTG